MTFCVLVRRSAASPVSMCSMYVFVFARRTSIHSWREHSDIETCDREDRNTVYMAMTG